MTPNLAESVNVSDENIRDKIHLRTGYEGPEAEKRYGCTLSLTSATHRPLCPLAKTTGTCCTGGWFAPGGRSGRMRKFFPPPGFDLQTVQPLASRYTDYATQVLRREVPPSYSEQTKCWGPKKEVAVYFQCSGTSIPNNTTLRVDSSRNTDYRGECEISYIHLDSLLDRGLLPIGSRCGFCR